MVPHICNGPKRLLRRSGPDKLGVMFEISRSEPAQNILAKLYIRGIALNSRQDFESPAAQSVVEMFRQSKLPVWLDHSGRMECVHPSREIQGVLIAGQPPRTPQVAKEAADWNRACEILHVESGPRTS